MHIAFPVYKTLSQLFYHLNLIIKLEVNREGTKMSKYIFEETEAQILIFLKPLD